jgi:hypothetical protein
VNAAAAAHRHVDPSCEQVMSTKTTKPTLVNIAAAVLGNNNPTLLGEFCNCHFHTMMTAGFRRRHNSPPCAPRRAAWVFPYDL